METLATTGISGLSILFIALAVWFLTSKQTRKSIGNTVTETALTVEQSLKISRATAYAEAVSEVSDLAKNLEDSNNFLGVK